MFDIVGFIKVQSKQSVFTEAISAPLCIAYVWDVRDTLAVG